MIKKIIALTFLVFVTFCSYASSVSELSWKILEQANVQFDNGNYGEALKLSNKALLTRKNEIEGECKILDIALSPVPVQRAGSEFVKVIPVLQEREQKEALLIINKYLSLHDRFFFDDNIHVMLDWLTKKNVYPEANYLIGKIYQVEGEYKTALDFLTKAYSQKEYLDIPDVEYEILYSMAFLYKLQDNKESFEKTLLLVLKNDDSFSNESLKESVLRTVNAEKKNSVDRVFTLYRAKTTYSLSALYELSNLYNERKDIKNSLYCTALGAIEAFTHMLEIINSRDSRFKFTTLEAFLTECGKYEEIVEWGKTNHVWEMFYLFAQRAGSSGKLVFSQNLFIILSKSVPDIYFKQLAAEKIK